MAERRGSTGSTVPGTSARPQRVLVVVPAWNEEQCVSETVAEVFASTADVDVVVVDDGSSDRTAQRARAAGADVLELPYNLGVGGAMRAGFRYALRHGYDVVVQVDADGQHNPADIDRLVDALAGVDLVIGARFADGGGRDAYPVRGPRWWAMLVMAKVLSRITGARLTDATSGFRATGRSAMQLFAQHYPVEYLGDTIESLVIAARSGCRVVQVPVTMRSRRGGTPSHHPAKAFVYLVRANLALLLAVVRRWPRSPVLTEERSL